MEFCMELQAQSQVNVWTQINEKTMETALRGHVTAHSDLA